MCGCEQGKLSSGGCYARKAIMNSCSYEARDVTVIMYSVLRFRFFPQNFCAYELLVSIQVITAIKTENEN